MLALTRSAPIHPKMLLGFGADAPSADAWEEAEGYALEMAELQELVDRLSRDLGYLLQFKSLVRMDWQRPMGPLGSAAEYASTARVPLEIEEGPAPQRVTGLAPRNFEGRLIGGTCQYTGMPLKLQMTLDGTLDADSFKLKFNKDGMQVPGFGLRCPPGGGMSSAMMMPPQGPNEFEIQASQGAEVIYPYATSPMAMLMSQVARVSGDATMEIERICKPER
jgi:hypothetical protein